MAKKREAKGLDMMFNSSDEPNTEPKDKKERKWIAATYNYDIDILEKVKDLAYWERNTIKDVLQSALSEHIDKYEKKNGVIKPRPKGK